MEANKKTIKGGEFVIRETAYTDIFIPEEFDEEAKMIRQTCLDFLEAEVLDNLDRIDAQEEGLMQSLMDKAGELGMLGVSIPEEYGGFGKNFNTSMLVAEAVGGGFSFAVALSAHTGIGTLPILYYGNAEQKNQIYPQARYRRVEGCLLFNGAKCGVGCKLGTYRSEAKSRRHTLLDQRSKDVDY